MEQARPRFLTSATDFEADGGQRCNSFTDKKRSDYLMSHGFRILRFWNNDIVANEKGVCE